MAAAAGAYEELRLHDALEAVVAIAGRGNLYMEQVAPWTAFKKVRPCTLLNFEDWVLSGPLTSRVHLLPAWL